MVNHPWSVFCEEFNGLLVGKKLAGSLAPDPPVLTIPKTYGFMKSYATTPSPLFVASPLASIQEKKLPEVNIVFSSPIVELLLKISLFAPIPFADVPPPISSITLWYLSRLLVGSQNALAKFCDEPSN
jgi:hypothetical protein